MMKLDVEEGSIARLCGSLKGTVHGGMDKIFAERADCTALDAQASETLSAAPPKAEFPKPRDIEKMEDQVWNTVLEMLEDAEGSDVLLRHLLADILRLKGSQSRLARDIECGVLHPSQTIPEFVTADHESGFSLKRRRDFLERGMR